jgi:DNA-binding transcriptional LysR family regulator
MHHLESGTLKTVLDSCGVEFPGLSLYYPSRSTSLPKLRAFIDFAGKRLRRAFTAHDYLRQ